MLSYDGVIRKRLRLKNHPELPPYPASAPEPEPKEAPAAEVLPTSDVVPQAQEVPAQESDADSEADYEAPATDHAPPPTEDRPSVPDAAAEESEIAPVKDSRTEAQIRHDEIMERRELERMREQASHSYREKVDVRITHKLTQQLVFGILVRSVVTSC